MVRARKNYLNLFFIFAFVLSGISPACAFLSGKAGFISICAADGSLTQIEITEDMAVYALYEAMNQDQSETPPAEHTKMPDCMFCFFNAGFGKNIVSVASLQNDLFHQFLSISSGTIIFKSATKLSFNARAPPLLV